MKQRIIINSDSYETRVAILENDELAELFVERAEQRRNVGDIYKARVNAVLPGMQSAFVDLGLPKTGFLHASDLAESLSGLEDLSDADDSIAPTWMSLVQNPAARGLLGASFGAVASLSTAWRHPGFFGKLKAMCDAAATVRKEIS